MKLESRKESGTKILEGVLICEQCVEEYAIEDGAGYFLEDLPGDVSDFSSQWRYYFEHEAEHEGILYGQNKERELDVFLEVSGYKREDLSDKVILEAGCGTGRLALSLAELGATVVGTDIYLDPVLIKRSAQNESCSFIRADLRRVPFSAESFDLVSSIGVLMCIRSIKEAFAALARQVRIGGKLVIYVYLKGQLRYLRLRPFFRALGIHKLPPPQRWQVCKSLGRLSKLVLVDIGRLRPNSPAIVQNFALGYYDTISPQYLVGLDPGAMLALYRSHGFSEVRQDGKGNFCGVKGRVTR